MRLQRRDAQPTDLCPKPPSRKDFCIVSLCFCDVIKGRCGRPFGCILFNFGNFYSNAALNLLVYLHNVCDAAVILFGLHQASPSLRLSSLFDQLSGLRDTLVILKLLEIRLESFFFIPIGAILNLLLEIVYLHLSALDELLRGLVVEGLLRGGRLYRASLGVSSGSRFYWKSARLCARFCGYWLGGGFGGGLLCLWRHGTARCPGAPKRRAKKRARVL